MTTRKRMIKCIVAAIALACAGFAQNASAAAITVKSSYPDYIYITMGSVSGATSYQLYRSTSSSFSSASCVYSGSSRKIRDWGPILGRKYYYWRGYTKGGKKYYTKSSACGWRKMTLSTSTTSGSKVWLSAKLNGSALASQNVTWKLTWSGVHKWTKKRSGTYLGYFTSKKRGKGYWTLKVGDNKTLTHKGTVNWK